MKNLLFIAIIAVVGLTSCEKFLEDSTTKVNEQNQQEILDYINKTNLKAQAAASGSGVYYAVTKSNPSGRTVAAGDEVTLNFKISLLNGTLVDSSFATKKAQIVFGAINAIPGFLEAIYLLKNGESGTFLIPSIQAWGTNGNGSNVPANAVVRIDLTVDKFRSEDDQMNDYVTAKKLTVTEKTSSGLRFVSTKKNATGTEIKNGNTVTVKYTGKLLTDKQFDTGSFDMTIGAKGVISGFEEAVLKLRLGEAGTFILPSSIAYGKTGSGSTIAPYSPLVFDIEVTGVK
jgi:FKBP-type peptidyl-prolyl cis-trans isomerase